MALDYQRLAETARRLIGENGRTVTLVRQGVPADPAKPWEGAAQEETLEVSAVFVEFSRRDVDGERVMRGDKRAVIPALDVGEEDLATYGAVVDGGDRWQAVAVMDKRPGDTGLTHELQVRL